MSQGHRSNLIRAFTAAMLLAAVAVRCGNSNDPTPSISISGEWSGPIQDSVVGSGTLEVNLVQSGNSLSGTWTSFYPNSSFDAGGAITGTVTGPNITASLTSNGSCPLSVTFILNSDSTAMNGNYAAVNCTINEVGTFTIAKQQ